ncbi:MAG TPA: hypothetical protein VHW23_27790 [Kofleriaceae bacterium]|jgi:Tfp pilus assembly protein PilP|nr:hypothetical protein [Kofleriaceae bacterium]
MASLPVPRPAPACEAARPAWLALAALALVACGDDGGAEQARGVQAKPQGAAAAAAAGSKTLLAVKPHIEDRVACPIPDQPSDPKGGKCDPKAPSCGEHLYCLTLAQGSFCEPCPERDGIRHAFRERDFDPEHNRDPFQSFLVQVGPVPGSPSADPTAKCPREDQLVASSYSYADLKLVGIVAQGTQRKVLMTMGKEGYIIKRGDCVGKEKAVVKDIGLGYITFHGESGDTSMQLNPKQLLINEPVVPTPGPRTRISPALPPPAVLPPRAPAAGSSAAPGAPGVAPPAGAAPQAPAPSKP